MTLNLIETFKTSIYNPKHTRNMKTLVIYQSFQNVQNPYFQQIKFENLRLYADLYGIIYIVEGHTA